MVMLIKIVKEKDLEYRLLKVVKNKLENGILEIYMARPSVHIQMATVIGGTLRIATRKDMEQASGLVGRDTRGNTRRGRDTGMEYTHGQVEDCIMENGNRTREMVMAVTGIRMAMKSMESTRMVRNMERESLKRVTNYSESSTTKATLSSKLNSMLHNQNDSSK